MRNYELIFILHPDLNDEAVAEVCGRVKNWISDLGGTIKKEHNWGSRRLAYPIRKTREGQYLLYEMEFDPIKVTELEHDLAIVEPILRYMTVRLDN
jgi:small subunit ribosomal protein S6